MTDDFEALRATRADVDPPSPSARRAAQDLWLGGPTTVTDATAGATRGSRARAFSARVSIASLLVAALITAGWLVTRDRVNSVKPLHIVTVTSLAQTAATEPQVFLLVGSDSRAFVQSDEQKQEFGDPATTAGARADSMIVVRIDPHTQQVLAVSLPRDLLVDIPGCGRQKLDAALSDAQSCAGNHGGIGLLVQTITQDLGIPVNHVIEVEFPQFAALTDQLGGLRIDFPAPARDRYTGLNEPAGCTTLSGAQALAYVRSRHLEWADPSGVWHEDPTADLGRMNRQQLALRQLAAAAEARAGADPRPLLHALFAHITVDAGFTADDALRYFAAIHGDHTITMTLPTNTAVIDAQDVLLLDPSSHTLLEALAGHGTVGSPPPTTLGSPATTPPTTTEPTAC